MSRSGMLPEEIRVLPVHLIDSPHATSSVTVSVTRASGSPGPDARGRAARRPRVLTDAGP